MSRWADSRDPDDARETAAKNVSNDAETERATHRCPKCGDRYNTLPGHMRACISDDDEIAVDTDAEVDEPDRDESTPRRPQDKNA